MEDGGYRFANAEFESQFSVYATYYIRMAKEYAGWSQSPISPETKSEIEEKFLNARICLLDMWNQILWTLIMWML